MRSAAPTPIGYYLGSNPVWITWMVPLVAEVSVWITLASFLLTFEPFNVLAVGDLTA